MNSLEKLLRKIPLQDKIVLLEIIDALGRGAAVGLRAEKLSGSDLYKMRKGDFRIIFHREKGAAVIDAVRLRNESTYRRL